MNSKYACGNKFSCLFQILVHDQSKFPLVGELGFAVSPGAETFVSMQKNEVYKSSAKNVSAANAFFRERDNLIK